MLGTTLWFTIVFGLLGALLVESAAAFGRAATVAAAEHAVEAATHDAVAQYQTRLAAAIAADPADAPYRASQPYAGALGDAAPAYANAVATLGTVALTVTPAPAAAPPRFTTVIAVTPTTRTAPSCANDPHGADTIGWLQCNGFIAESRMSLRVDVTVQSPDASETIARRTSYVTLQLFNVPPYSAVAGRKDDAAADASGSDPASAPAHEGDIAGDTVSGAVPAAPSPWPAGGTLLHVRYRCVPAGPSCDNAHPPDPDAALHGGATWSNGNRPSP